MAKWGEGDPRWIVEDRPDATNVNNWHWSEKNASGWSKDKLKSLLEGLVLKKDSVGEVTLKSLSKCDGEATANNRKGKLIFFYEWVLGIDWVATLDDPDAAEAKGTIEIPNLSEENDSHEVDVNVTITAGGSSAEPIKTFLRTEGTKTLQAKLSQYITALREEYAQDLILPTSQSEGSKSNSNGRAPISTVSSKSKLGDSSVGSTITPLSTMDISMGDQGCKLSVKELSLRQIFKCRVDELYNAFTVTEMVAAFTRNSVKMEVAPGGTFQLFGGNITGIFDKLEPNKLIVQRWRFKTWPDGHHSIVTLDLTQKDDCTELTLLQTGIPSSDYDRTREGWHNYYWESMKRTFGFGATLM